MDERLIIFARNLIRGEVKSRIARKVGTDNAFEIYKLLLERTVSIVANLPERIQPVFYFSKYPEEIQNSASSKFRIMVQEGRDLGERMSAAIKSEIRDGADKVCIIGSDIYDLKEDILINAFNKLSQNELVLGPAKDGGYYLIGMREHVPEVFTKIEWGQSSVMQKTLKKIDSLSMKYHLLEPLNDVDEYKDIPDEIRRLLDL